LSPYTLSDAGVFVEYSYAFFDRGQESAVYDEGSDDIAAEKALS
jgi:hypothetical protein